MENFNKTFLRILMWFLNDILREKEWLSHLTEVELLGINPLNLQVYLRRWLVNTLLLTLVFALGKLSSLI
jgi:hypothetical protein